MGFLRFLEDEVAQIFAGSCISLLREQSDKTLTRPEFDPLYPNSIGILSSTMAESKPAISEIMAQIRRDASSSARAAAGDVPPYQPLKRMPPTAENRPLMYADELNYINAHYRDWFDSEPTASHRPVIGKVITAVKSRLRRFLRTALLPDYYQRQEEFLANLVRHLNENARYNDNRLYQIFWELTHKLDQDIAGVNARCDRAIDEVLAQTSHRLDQLETGSPAGGTAGEKPPRSAATRERGV